MSGESYDPYTAFARVVEQADQIGERELRVVVWHYVLERELEIMLAAHARRKPALRGFESKARMLYAIWETSDDRARILLDVLLAFNDLRNKVAHGNKGFEACHATLMEAFRKIETQVDEGQTDYGYIVQAICAFVGGGMMPDELSKFAEDLHKVVNNLWPAMVPKRS